MRDHPGDSERFRPLTLEMPTLNSDGKVVIRVLKPYDEVTEWDVKIKSPQGTVRVEMPPELWPLFRRFVYKPEELPEPGPNNLEC